MKNENIAEGLLCKMLDVNLVECGKEQCVPQKYVEPMAKDYYTIHYVTNGDGYIKCNGVRQEVSVGDCFIIYPKMLVEYYPKKDTPWCYSWIVFNGLYAERLVERIFPSRDKIVYKIGKSTVLEDLFDKLVYAYLKSGYITHETVGYTYLIFHQLMQTVNKKHVDKKIDQQSIHIREAKEFINFNYMFNITVEDIANSQHISSTYLSAIFRKQLHISPKQYITELRMRRAKEILENNNYKIKDVALMVGYNDQLHFSHEFKKTYGVSPSKIIKKD